jgi:phosphoribosyl 1,2-cyclic phosphodiesterase
MNFTPIASSSKGNAYLLESPGVEPLLIEAGIPIKQLREKLHFGLSGLAGCLISHEHGDHSKAVKDLLKAGVDCYMSPGTARVLGVEGHHRITTLRSGINIQIGEWNILPFPLQHDAAEPLGFLVGYYDVGYNHRFLFIPDTGFVKNRFTGVNLLAIECNHLEEKLSQNILNGSIPAVAGKRTRRNHMSLERVITMLKSNDLSRCREIYLLHLSNGNSDEKKMIQVVQEATGIPTRCCEE